MSDLNGIVNIMKPPGISSFQVVSSVKKILSCKKAGHTGTLDPAAMGVLPVCLGKATRIIPFIPEEEKEYLARITLGQITDTLDSEGKILEENQEWKNLTLETIERIIQKFTGEIKQIPPMYSAIHHDGKRLYQLAREGKEVERKARIIRIKEIELLAVKLPFIKIRVLCSKGTYIRTLAADIGEELRVGAHLSCLVRSRSGPFTIERAVSLEDLKRTGKKNILPIDYPLRFPELHVKKEALGFAKNGVVLYKHNFKEIPEKLEEYLMEDNRVSIYFGDLFISINELINLDSQNFECKPIRVFNIKRGIY